MLEKIQVIIRIIAIFTVLVLACFWYHCGWDYMEPIIVIVGAIEVILLLIVEYFVLKIKRKQIDKIGSKSLKYLDSDFLNNYIPGEISINKIIEDFGQPIIKVTDAIEIDEASIYNYNVYKYKFQNAVLWITTEIESDIVVSISLVPKSYGAHAVFCRYSYAEDDKIFGEANFSENIIENSEKFDSKHFANWGFSSVTSRYIDYTPIKYLHFTYWNYNYIENQEELLGKEIEGICISVSSNLNPIIHWGEFFYN